MFDSVFGFFIDFFYTMPHFYIPVIVLISGLTGSVIAVKKNKSSVIWFLLCIIPLFLIVIILKKHTDYYDNSFKQCPSCKEFMKWEKKICTNCKTPLKLSWMGNFYRFFKIIIRWQASFHYDNPLKTHLILFINYYIPNFLCNI